MSQSLPIFHVAAEQGKHPRVGLDRPVCVVGRKEPANLPLPAKEVSKLHALIVREQGRVYLRDLASTNGVEVNGAAVREVALSDADTVRIGSYTLRCQSGFGRNGRRDVNGQAGAVVGEAPPAELRGKAGNFSFADGRHTLLIGQRAACDVRIEHPSVAPVHAVVFEMDRRHYVQTFAPETATRLNGRPVHREALSPGDELLIGQVALRYALLDLSADTSAAAPVAMADTGDSLIQPALDSSIAPAVDPSHHGELEPDDDVEPALDVVDAEQESLIAPAMDSSAGAATGPAIAPAVAAESHEEEYGLDIEPIDVPVDDAPAPESAKAKPGRPAAPPVAAPPVAKAINEPVIEPVVDRAIESAETPTAPPAPSAPRKPKAEAAMNATMELEPVRDSDGDSAAPGLPSAAAADALAADDDDAPLELEPVGSSGDLDPIGLGGEQDRLFDNDLEESFGDKWEAASAKGQDRERLSATFDEDNALEPVSGPSNAPSAPAHPKRKQPAHDPRLSATFDEDNELDPVLDPGAERTRKPTHAVDAGLSATFDADDGLVPLTEPLDDAGLLGTDEHADLVPHLEPTADAPPAEPNREKPTGRTSAPPDAADAAGASASDNAAGATSNASSDQAAELAELARRAGFGEGAGGEAAGKAGDLPAELAATADEITMLVDEVAEKAQVLKEAWAEFQSAGAAAPPRPVRVPPPPPPPAPAPPSA